jgi:Protein of unknown function (DUF4011)
LIVLTGVPDPPTNMYVDGVKPDVKAYAAACGLNISIDSDSSNLRDPSLVSLRYTVELETRLRKISSEARTAIDETGSNMLYLIIGFLDCFDSDAS